MRHRKQQNSVDPSKIVHYLQQTENWSISLVTPPYLSQVALCDTVEADVNSNPPALGFTTTEKSGPLYCKQLVGIFSPSGSVHRAILLLYHFSDGHLLS